MINLHKKQKIIDKDINLKANNNLNSGNVGMFLNLNKIKTKITSNNMSQYFIHNRTLLWVSVWRHLGIQVKNFWSFGFGICSHSCLIYVSSCWRVRCRLWHIFHVMICQMFSTGEISGLQEGQFSTRTLLLRSHAVVIAAVCGFHCPAEIHNAFP